MNLKYKLKNGRIKQSCFLTLVEQANFDVFKLICLSVAPFVDSNAKR